jgi:2-polyprenyl-3-methyl-5-hydroxy-6-metoxy-1,4-benzoquinol methylase
MREHEIRPRELFDAFLEVAKRDIDVYFPFPSEFVEVRCPACDSDRGEPSFVKHGMQYAECPVCGSLFMSPRPTREMIDRYYRESESSRFWARRFFPETAEARRRLIFRPRAEVLAELLSRMDLPRPRIAADIGSGFGIFLEELRALDTFDEVVGIEPSTDLARASRHRGFRILEHPVESLAASDLQASVLTSFEVIEHLHSPLDFLRSAVRLLCPGGVVMFTTLTCSGWDIRLLWERSKSVSPPHHINLLSTEGLERLVARAGLELVDIATPGMLDVDIVGNMVDEDPGIPLDRFSSYLLRHRGDVARADLQALLQRHCLSSHVRVVARAPRVQTPHPQSRSHP